MSRTFNNHGMFTPALGLVVAVLLWGPARGEASCGHHVVVTGESVGNHTTPAKAPCTGPTCRAGDSTPLVPPASAPRTVLANDILCDSLQSPETDNPVSGFLSDGVNPIPCPLVSSIFHPPRA